MKKIFTIGVIILLIIGGLYSYFILGNQMRASRGISKGEEYASKMYGVTQSSERIVREKILTVTGTLRATLD
jgi:hypothetical protein